MVTVDTHRPPPTPPLTFDLLGLTVEEMQAISAVLGRLSSHDSVVSTWDLFDKVSDAIEDAGEKPYKYRVDGNKIVMAY